MSYRERQRLADIQAAIDAIRSHLQRGDLSDGLVFDAVRIRLLEIGEAVKALPDDLLPRARSRLIETSAAFRYKPLASRSGCAPYTSCAVLRALLPGMDRLVAVHELDIPLGHLAQRLRAVGSALGECCGRLDLPGGASPAGEAALLDDAQQAVGIDWIDAPAGQSLAGQR